MRRLSSRRETAATAAFPSEEKNTFPRGGPDGGDGGNGGDAIVFEADGRLRTLADFRYQRVYRAKAGENGSGRNKKGAEGEDLVIHVPVGTVVKNQRDGQRSARSF